MHRNASDTPPTRDGWTHTYMHQCSACWMCIMTSKGQSFLVVQVATDHASMCSEHVDKCTSVLSFHNIASLARDQSPNRPAQTPLRLLF
mmetsp:Transcript_73946/g.203600  ORF Transcript_73946/g.203600 Transcript_73946/m.203600 type:complete len:89 (-) Transcript_73946:421-687(-)